MASSVSGQDESNPALWLATRAGKRELSCPLRTSRHVPQEKFSRKPYDKPLLTKLVRSRWLDIGLVLILRVYGPRLRLGPWTRKKRTWPISSHFNRTSLVNNPYIFANSFISVFFTAYKRWLSLLCAMNDATIPEWGFPECKDVSCWPVIFWNAGY